VPDCSPFFEPGQDPTCVANGPVTGCRFVRIKPGVNAVNDLAQVETCPAAAKAFGVAARDKLDGQAVMVFRHGVVPVLCAGAIAHGVRVESDAQGRAVPLAAGVELGVCMADAADATFAKIALTLGA
jgi:predicted RecA/RadA family phage recombinase